MRNRRRFMQAALASVVAPGVAPAEGTRAGDNPFAAPVLTVRPRVFLRRDAFDGLTIDGLRQAATGPELSAFRQKWKGSPLGHALLWMTRGEEPDLRAAIRGLKDMRIDGSSWSDRGLQLMQVATLFDWLYQKLDPPIRAAIIERIEAAADQAVDHIERGRAPFYYSRTPGALAGMTVAGIALNGVSPKAERYLQLFRGWGVHDYFQAYRWVDGAATGATYTMFYTFVDLPSICAAWWSATGVNPAPWIRQHQGDWLNGIVRFYLWAMRPGFAFTDINDQFRRLWNSHDEYCQGLDIASYVTGNGYGRTWSQRWRGRFGPALYHTEYAHNAIFRAAHVAPKPLSDLPRAALFGRESCGYGFFRSHWPKNGQPDDAAHVFFRCGDPINVHGGVAAGEFQVFRYAPLAVHSGRYHSYDSPSDQYHRNCISHNVLLITDPENPRDRGDQRTRQGLKDDHRTWKEWLEIRRRYGLDVARITHWQAGDGEARCRADLSGAIPAGKCRRWIREFVWLADRHLIVLDIVETSRPEITRRWQLHSAAPAVVGDRRVVVENRPPEQRWADPRLQPKEARGVLLCQTLEPRQYRLLRYANGQAETFDASGTRIEAAAANPHHLQWGANLIQIDPGDRSTRSLLLNVLTAQDARNKEVPVVRHRLLAAGKLEVRVDGAAARLTVPAWYRPS